MSAIGGYLAFDGDFVDKVDFEAMSRSLASAGPDRSGGWIKDPFGAFHHLLATTPEDLASSQPVEVGDIVVAADVRLDNRDDLLSKLGLFATTPLPQSDSLLIARAFEKWGPNCLEHLIGEFAFAIWNKKKNELFLARDQRGFRPLFYHLDSKGFAFASLPVALFKIPRIRPQIDERKMKEFLLLSHRDHANTHFKGIYRLPPAHSMTVRQGQVSQHRYWRFDPQKRLTFRSMHECLDQAEEILRQCIRSSLRCHGPVASFLSGGLDSSTVAWHAANELRKSGTSLTTYTEAPPASYSEAEIGRYYFDETPFVKEIASRLPNVDTRFISPESFDLLDPSPKRHLSLCSPARNPCNQLWMGAIAREASNNGARVILTGQSGNMSLSYHGLHLLPALAKSGKIRALAREMRATSEASELSTAHILRSKVLSPLLPAWGRKLLTQSRNRNLAFWDNYSALHPKFADDPVVASIVNAQCKSPLADSRRFRINFFEGFDYIGELSQLYSRSCGIELRDPLGDIRFIEFCLAVDDRVFLSNGRQRNLPRKLMEGHLPPSVLNNRKRGLQFANWHQILDSKRDRIADEIAACQRSSACVDLLDIDQMIKLVDDWPTRDWHLASVTQSYRFFLIRGLEAGSFIRWIESPEAI